MAVYIASHDHFELDVPTGYRPLFVGAALHPQLERRDGWAYDDKGDSISSKNDTFCELTGLYWAWKHDKDDLMGLIHYRRYFLDEQSGEPLSSDDLKSRLIEHDCVVAERSSFVRFGSFITAAEQYRLLHSSLDLRILRDVFRRNFKPYLDAFDTCMERSWMFPCNMLATTQPVFARYCQFLFDALNVCEHSIDPYTNRSRYQSRLFGFMGERLLNVFLEKHQLITAEVPFGDPKGDEVGWKGADESIEPRTPVAESLRGYKPRFDGHDYSAVFDAEFYASHYEDVNRAAAGDPDTAFQHFVLYGMAEGRQGHPRFSLSSYKNAHPELAEACGDDLHAWCRRYIASRRFERYGFGYENFDFQEHAQPGGDGAERYALDGQAIRRKDIDRAARRAEKQGVIA